MNDAEWYESIIWDLDFEEIESCRREIGPQDLPDLVTLYGLLDTWPRRLALVQLVQDRPEPELAPIMLDILRAPDLGDDLTDLTKAAALGHIDERYATFMTFYQDRAALRRAVADVLQENGLTLDHAEPQAPAETAEPDRSAETPLFQALVKGHLDTAAELVAQGASVTDRRVSDQTPLMWAASYGDERLVSAILARGAGPDDHDRNGATPLIWAAQDGHTGAVRILLAAGADPHRALRGAGFPDGRTALHLAASNGHAGVVAALLDGGADVDGRAATGSTPLHEACEENQAAVVRLLLDRGAGVDPVADDGRTPLMAAVMRGLPTLVDTLLAAGADGALVAPHGRFAGQTPADLATGPRATQVRERLRAG